MSTLQTKVDDFLAQKRIAVAGVSRTNKSEAANSIYRKLRDEGYEVFAVNPRAENVEGDVCYASLKDVPGEIDGVVISVPPKATEELVHECAEVGIKRVWMHRSFAGGSVSQEAVDFCNENDISVIAGACPMMYCSPDFAHKCMHWVMGVFGKLPE